MKRIAPLTVAYPPLKSTNGVSPSNSARLFKRRMLLLATFATVLITGLAAIIFINVSRYQYLNSVVHHAYQIEQLLAKITSDVSHVQAMHQGYLRSGDESLLESYYGQLPDLRQELDTLVGMSDPSHGEKARTEALRSLVNSQLDKLDKITADFHTSGTGPIDQHLKDAADGKFPHAVYALTKPIRQYEDTAVVAASEGRERLAKVTISLTIASLLASVVLIWRGLALAIREQHIRTHSEQMLAAANADLATLLEQSQQLTDQLTRLSDFGEMLQSCRKLSEALALIGASMPDLLPGSAGAIQLLNTSHNMVETSAEWGTPAIGYESVFPPDDCLALRRGHAYPPPGGHAVVHCQHLLASPAAAATNPYLCVPLINQGDTLGLLHVQPHEPLSNDMRRLLLTVGEHLALALGNLHMQEALRMQSIRDPLTGLFNRRYLEASLSRELLRAQRNGRPLALLMLDIDHFKRFNDTYGHEAGDHLLVQLAATVKHAIRTEEIACRFGGEEFTVILPEITCDVARRRAEDIRLAVSSMDVRYQDEPLGTVTCSLGVACFPQHGIDAGQLMRAADAALYEAKRAGRNRTETAAEV